MSTCNRCPRRTTDRLCSQCQLEASAGMACCQDCNAMIHPDVSECPECGTTEAVA